LIWLPDFAVCAWLPLRNGERLRQPPPELIRHDHKPHGTLLEQLKKNLPGEPVAFVHEAAMRLIENEDIAVKNPLSFVPLFKTRKHLSRYLIAAPRIWHHVEQVIRRERAIPLIIIRELDPLRPVEFVVT